MFTQAELQLIAETLDERLNRGGLTVKEGNALTDLADKVVGLQEADQDDEAGN